MKAISFLGTGDYKETTYVWEGREFRTRFFGETLPHFFPELERVLVFVTPTVQVHSNWTELQHRLGELASPVPIPEGHSESELWEIFDALTGAVAEQDTVIFDITNSFRSIFLLVFLAVGYLRTARRIVVHRVIYGAWEARDRATDRSPVFDLTPFVTLLDWLAATNQFIHTGDARYLARLLTAEGQKRGSNALKGAGEQLQNLSLGMMLCRPLEVMEQAGRVERALAAAEADLAQWAHPFGLLAQRIQEEYAARALRYPTAPENVEQNLRHQFILIRWYLDNNQIIQAMTLAREWIITVTGWKLGRGFLLDLKEREKVERALGGLVRIGRVQEDGTCFGVGDLNDEGRVLWDWPERETLRELWNNLTTVRNELDHAGMNPGPMKVAKLVRKAREEVWPGLDKLAHLWELT